MRHTAGSSILGWLLVGPILLGVCGMVAHQATGFAAFRLVAQVGLVGALVVAALAFLAGWRAGRPRRGLRRPSE